MAGSLRILSMVSSRALLRFGQQRRPDVGPHLISPPPSRPPRTAVVLPSRSLFSAINPNSMETVVRSLAEAQDYRETRIFCDEGAGDHQAPGVEILPVGPERRRVLIEKLRRFRPEVIEHHQQPKQAAAVSTALPEAAHLFYFHSTLKPPRSRLDAWRYNARYSRADGLVFVSAAARALFVRAYPMLADKAWAVPNPINAEPWFASPDAREPVIAFAGRAMREKGVDVICAALPAILDRHPAWRAVLMLNDWNEHRHWAAPHVAPLARYADRVTVLRSVSLAEVRRQMKLAAIALTPSIWAEPFGLAAVEAHAAGAALVSSGRGGLREASGPHALYLDAVTERTLTSAIEHLIAHPSKRLEMARAAQHYVMTTHTPGKRAAELLRIRQFVGAQRRISQ